MIKQDGFCAALKIALHSAAGKKEDRRYLQSVLFRFYGAGFLKLVSTNGHVLSVVNVQLSSAHAGPLDFLLGRESIEELLALFKPHGDKDITMSITDDTLYFVNGQDARCFKPLEEQFPDYEQVMIEGGNPAPKVMFSASLIEKALKACKGVMDKKDPVFSIELQDDRGIAYLRPTLKEGLANIQDVTIGVMPRRQC